jgi:hypothetical protein
VGEKQFGGSPEVIREGRFGVLIVKEKYWFCLLTTKKIKYRMVQFR